MHRLQSQKTWVRTHTPQAIGYVTLGEKRLEPPSVFLAVKRG